MISSSSLESTSATTTYHRTTVDGVGVFYREAGPNDAPTIVLLHGFPSSSREFNTLIPLLATRYHLGAVTGSLIWPELRRRGRNEALRPLLMFHSFRFIGLAFLVPGVVSADLPAAFAEGAAYGDIVAAALALLTLALLPGRLGIVAAWVFNLWGSADIVHANYEGIHLRVQAGQLGAAYFLPTFIVPLFLITHGLMFWLLLRNESEAAVPAARRLA